MSFMFYYHLSVCFKFKLTMPSTNPKKEKLANKTSCSNQLIVTSK